MKKQILSLALCVIGSVFNHAQESTKETVLFASDHYDLDVLAENKLEHFVGSLENRNVKSIRLVGHTDGDGSNNYNSILSEKRALEVKGYLEKQGVEADKIAINFSGEVMPVATNLNENGKHSNRRVEIHVDYNQFTIPAAFLVAPTIYRVSPLRDTVLKIGTSGGQIVISKYSFKDQNRSLIQDTVEILFSEYTNPAEIAFSGIPMTYKEEGEEKFMSSSGMFEIQGQLNGHPISLTKPIKVDYQMLDSKPDVGFYKLEKDKNWKKEFDVSTRTIMSSGIDTVYPYLVIRKYDVYNYQPVSANNLDILIERALIREGKWNERWNKKLETIEQYKWKWKKKRKMERTLHTMHSQHKRNQNRGKFVKYYFEYSTTSMKVSTVETPKLLKGLNIESFGKYNCDQIYRLPNKTRILAQYVDEKGEPILNPAFLSMVDPHYNGAFSFMPKEFTCNRKAKNILALFTEDGKLYLSDENTFPTMNIKRNGTYTFRLKNMTEKIKSKSDLAKYLRIKTNKKRKS